jgi:hypothetical protein
VCICEDRQIFKFGSVYKPKSKGFFTLRFIYQPLAATL